MDARKIAVVACLIFGSCEAPAQPGSSDRILGPITRCRAITEREARLDCFDKATGALEEAVKSREVTILDRQDVRKARRSLFGFTIPRIALFGGGGGKEDIPEEREEFTELNTIIVSAHARENGRIEFKVEEEDAVWMTTDPMPFAPKAGSKVRIRKGALGNYFISVAGERSVRGMRIR